MTDLTHRDPADVARPFTQTLAVQLTGRRRLSVLLRPLYAFLATLYLVCYLGLGWVLALVAWLAILVTGQYPPEIYAYNTAVTRMTARYYSYLLIAHDVAPPLHGDPDDGYPLQLEIPPARPAYDRRALGLHLLRAFPVALLGTLTYTIGGFYAVYGTFAILFTGRLPVACAEPLRDASAAVTRVCAHLLLLQPDPPTLRASA